MFFNDGNNLHNLGRGSSKEHLRQNNFQIGSLLLDKKIFKVLAIVSFSDTAAYKVLHEIKLFKQLEISSLVEEEKSFEGKSEQTDTQTDGRTEETRSQ